MAPRPTWKGHLKLSLVSCPVRVFNAVSGREKVSFNLLHKDTHNRVQMKPHDPELGAVERGDLVKGYQYEKDKLRRLHRGGLRQGPDRVRARRS